MADQNLQADKNLNNQNENDELFGGSDDIFENSDLLQPINSEIDSAHHVVKSQNELNNFSGEVQSNKISEEENLGNIMDEEPEESKVSQPSEPMASDDLFNDQPQEQKESNENFESLYDDNENSNNQTQENNLSVNDDIFEEEPVIENKIDEIPELDDLVQENGQNFVEESKVDEQEKIVDEPQILEQQEVIEEPGSIEEPEPIEEPVVVEKPDIENANDDLSDREQGDDIQESNNVEDFDDVDDVEDFDDIDEIDDIDDVEDEENFEKDQEAQVNTNEYISNEEDDNLDNKSIGSTVTEHQEPEEDSFDEPDNFDDAETTEKTDEEEQETMTIQDYEKYDPNLFKTDLQKKFGELQRKTEKIHELVGKDQDIGFDLLGGNDDRQKTIYKILSGDDYVEIEKEELNKEDESTETNILAFALNEDLENNKSLQLFVNDIELYDEIKDLQNDPNKKMQVLEKMNKFIFLLDEEYKKIQKYKKEKEERNAVKGVFRNF